VSAQARLHAALEGQGVVDAELLDAFSEVLRYPVEDVRLALIGAVRARGAPVSRLEIRTGAWRMDLETAVLKAVSCSIVTTLVLQGLGADSIPASVLSIVAPFLFELERVDVAADDVWVHARLLDAAQGDVVHLRELYERLQPDVRAELSERDFVAVVERLQAARLLVIGPAGVQIMNRPRGKGFRLLLS
jgi:hypothetical protein